MARLQFSAVLDEDRRQKGFSDFEDNVLLPLRFRAHQLGPKRVPPVKAASKAPRNGQTPSCHSGSSLSRFMGKDNKGDDFKQLVYDPLKEISTGSRVLPALYIISTFRVCSLQRPTSGFYCLFTRILSTHKGQEPSWNGLEANSNKLQKGEFDGQKMTVCTENSRLSSRITDTFLALRFLLGQSLTQAQHCQEKGLQLRPCD